MSEQASLANATDELTVMRRIRHITSVQIRNLTPFPARDSFASALTQPAEQSQFTSHGHLSDDLDVAMQRKRSRRISVNSASTLRSIRLEDGARDEGLPSGTHANRGRKNSGPRVSFPSEGGDSRQQSTLGSASTIRPHRVRTNSMASSISSQHVSGSSQSISSLYNGVVAVGSSFTSMIPDNSQAELEKVIQSRLVETFLAITIPRRSAPRKRGESHGEHSQATSPLSLSGRGKPSLSTTKVAESHSHNKPAKPSSFSPSDKSMSRVRREAVNMSPNHTRSASTSAMKANGEYKRTPLQSPSTPLVGKSFSNPETPVPNYFSPIHRPSTHPHFTIDARTEHCFTEGTDRSGHIMKIEVWGKIGTSLLGKGKEKEVNMETDSGALWKILEERDVDLMDLIPLSDIPSSHASQLPSNSLLIALSPPGETFYLPPQSSSPDHAHSPSGGYSSDPERNSRRLKQIDQPTPPTTTHGQSESGGFLSLSQRRHRGGGDDTANPLSPSDISTTAGWQDLFKLVTLQSCILDTRSSLFDLVRGIDKVLQSDTTLIQRREMSERHARLEELATSHNLVVQEIDKLRKEMQTRIESLRRRKQILELAKDQLRQDVESENQMEETIVQYRAQRLSLHGRFGPTRTTVLSILSSMFPIELLSPPDLLYTILDVPLPIPLASSDPAPPLTLSLHKDVTEDAVATSLGYAAQLLQLLAVYLGKTLVYPVTSIGSRSLIRDNISTMVGPRMFPLYSKGVDTYRFEYGVFLLNKNIELLMADRDLRALDMRHTLPNLKNLLLTLTDGEGARLQHFKPPYSPISLTSDVELPSQSGSYVEANSTTLKASETGDIDDNTPPASGSTTPTPVVSEMSKRSRPFGPFLGFSPLTDFWRGRYPSSSRTSAKSSPDTDEVEESEENRGGSAVLPNDSSDEEEDRKTISDVARDAASEGRQHDSTSTANRRDEKLDDENPSPMPLPLTQVVR